MRPRRRHSRWTAAASSGEAGRGRRARSGITDAPETVDTSTASSRQRAPVPPPTPSPPAAASGIRPSPPVFPSGSTNSTPIISPLPRTSPTQGNSRGRPWSWISMRAPRVAARSARRFCRTWARVAVPAAMASWLPRKVPVGAPGSPVSRSARWTTTASGRLPPMALERTITSGVTPLCSTAQKAPVRPTPVSISSAIIGTDRSAVSCRMRRSQASGAGITPPSPWTGSTIIPAGSDVPDPGSSRTDSVQRAARSAPAAPPTPNGQR